MAETGLGLVPDLGGTYPLVHAVGFARAVELCLTGRAVGAEEAVRIGLAVRAVPGAELGAATEEIVRAVLAAPDAAVRETLGLLAGVAEGAGPATALAAERAAQLRLLRAMFGG
jgi:enoyl-CoA hydratase/carnithine racemase